MNSIARLLSLLTVILFVLIAAGGLVWYLSYGIQNESPAYLPLRVLQDTTHIGWGPHSEVTIEAAGVGDAMTALGFAHGHDHAWSVALWRQAAMGRLAEWFGDEALPLDRLTRHLGLAALAEKSFDLLDSTDQAMLQAYAAGFNAALQSPDVRLQQEFVLIDPDLEPWLPWHTLAVERLFAWLASPPPPPSVLAAADKNVHDFYEADRLLREWLHLHGFENSIAWAINDSTGTHFFQRHVYGSTALPFFQEVALHIAGQPALWGASLPGTPFFPAGKRGNAAWAILLSSTVHLQEIPLRRDTIFAKYQRILSKDGAEHLTRFWRINDLLPFPSADTTAIDTMWAVQWPGLLPASDCAAWRGLWMGPPQPFHLLEGSGLAVDTSGARRILGTPGVQVSFATGTFVGLSPWSRYAAEFLLTQLSGQVQLESWIDDAYSIWAAQTAPPLVNAVSMLPMETQGVRDAVTYLRNWDYAFDHASIAASIFDRWMTVYLETTGTLPGTEKRDTVSTRDAVLRATFTQAVETLTETFGADQSQWRWERVQPDRRFFPIWSAESLKSTPARDRFAPVEWPGHGHPSSLAWGPSATQQTLAAPAVWEAWLHSASWNAMHIRRRRVNPHAPMGRYLVSDRPTQPFTLPSAVPPASKTTLTPIRP